MNRNILIASILLIILILVGGGLFLYTNKDPQTTVTPSNGSSFFPITSNDSSTNQTTIANQNNQTPSEINITDQIPEPTTQEVVVFKKLTTGAVSGYITLGSGASSSIRYSDSQNGNIFETSFITESPKRLTNTTLTHIYDSQFTGDGKYIVNRYRKGTEFYTQAYKVPSTSTSSNALNLEPLAFSKTTREIVLNPLNTSLAYISGTNGTTEIRTADLLKPGEKTVFRSPISEWFLSWANPTTITLTNKPSVASEGYLYTVNSSNLSFSRILGSINGFTSLINPNGRRVLYSRATQGGFSARLFYVQEGFSQGFPVNTLPEKCVWSKDEPTLTWCAVPRIIPTASYPDDWYKGAVVFTDDIWAIDTNEGDANLIFSPEREGAGESIDAIELKTDPSESYLYFINKQNGTLWGLSLTGDR